MELIKGQAQIFGSRIRHQGERGELLFLCRFWCQGRACAARRRLPKICERPWAANSSSSALASQFSNNFLFILLLFSVCVCDVLPLIANAGEMESALKHKTPTVVETVELHKYFYFYFYFYDAACSDSNNNNKKMKRTERKTRDSKKSKRDAEILSNDFWCFLCTAANS